jgi:hypothetical protein
MPYINYESALGRAAPPSGVKTTGSVPLNVPTSTVNWIVWSSSALLLPLQAFVLGLTERFAEASTSYGNTAFESILNFNKIFFANLH